MYWRKAYTIDTFFSSFYTGDDDFNCIPQLITEKDTTFTITGGINEYL